MNQHSEGPSDPPLDLRKWATSVEPYADWIDRKNSHEAKLWASELRDGSPEQVEGRVAEAVAWDWLVRRVDSIESVHRGSKPVPDFRCRSGGNHFCIEVANVSRTTMTKVTGLGDGEIVRKAKFFGSPAETLHRTILDKGNQGAGLNEPYLVFVTTLHWNASGLLVERFHLASVLDSKEFLQGAYDPKLGQLVGGLRNVVDFRRAAFTKSKTLDRARSHVSGALFGPFGYHPLSALETDGATGTTSGDLNARGTSPPYGVSSMSRRPRARTCSIWLSMGWRAPAKLWGPARASADSP